MEFIDFLRNIWFILIGVLLAGYAILDGFDLGVGSMLPFLAKKKEVKAKKPANEVFMIFLLKFIIEFFSLTIISLQSRPIILILQSKDV